MAIPTNLDELKRNATQARERYEQDPSPENTIALKEANTKLLMAMQESAKTAQAINQPKEGISAQGSVTIRQPKEGKDKLSSEEISNDIIAIQKKIEDQVIEMQDEGLGGRIDRTIDKASEMGFQTLEKGMDIVKPFIDILSAFNYAQTAAMSTFNSGLKAETGAPNVAEARNTMGAYIQLNPVGAAKLGLKLTGQSALEAGKAFIDPLIPGDQGGKELSWSQVLEEDPTIGKGTKGDLSLSNIPGLGDVLYSETGSGSFKDDGLMAIPKRLQWKKGGIMDWTVRGVTGTALDIFADISTYATLGMSSGIRVTTKEGAKALTKKGAQRLKSIADDILQFDDKTGKLLFTTEEKLIPQLGEVKVVLRNRSAAEGALRSAVDDLSADELIDIANRINDVRDPQIRKIETQLHASQTGDIKPVPSKGKTPQPFNQNTTINRMRADIKGEFLTNGIDPKLFPDVANKVQGSVRRFSEDRLLKEARRISKADKFSGAKSSPYFAEGFGFALFGKQASVQIPEIASDIVKSIAPKAVRAVASRATAVGTAINEAIRGRFTKLRSDDPFFRRIYETHITSLAARHAKNAEEIQDLYKQYSGKVDHVRVMAAVRLLRAQRNRLYYINNPMQLQKDLAQMGTTQVEQELAKVLAERLDGVKNLGLRFDVNPEVTMLFHEERLGALGTPITKDAIADVQDAAIELLGEPAKVRGLLSRLSSQLAMTDVESLFSKAFVKNGKVFLHPEVVLFLKNSHPELFAQLPLRKNWAGTIFETTEDMVNRSSGAAFERTVAEKFGQAESGSRLTGEALSSISTPLVKQDIASWIDGEVVQSFKKHQKIPVEGQMVAAQLGEIDRLARKFSGQPKVVRQELIRNLMIRSAKDRNLFEAVIAQAIRIDGVPDWYKYSTEAARDGLAIKTIQGTDYLLPKAILEDLDKMPDFLLKDKGFQKMLSMWDRVTSAFKTYHTIIAPAFHFRNWLSGVMFHVLEHGLLFFRNYIPAARILKSFGKEGYRMPRISNAVPPPKMAFEKEYPFGGGVSDLSENAERVLSAPSQRFDGITSKTGEKYTLEQIKEAALRYGVIKPSKETGDLLVESTVAGKGFSEPMSKARTARSVAGKAVYESIPVLFGAMPPALGTRLGGFFESWERLNIFMNSIRKGESLEQAAATVNRFMVDYSNLGTAEKALKRIGLPFVTWIRNMAPVVLSEALQKPGRMVAFNKLMRPMQDDEDKYLPSYMMSDGTTVRVNLRDNGNLEVIEGMETPLSTLKIFNTAATSIKDDWKKIGLFGLATGAIRGTTETAGTLLGPGVKQFIGAFDESEGLPVNKNGRAIATILTEAGLGGVANALVDIRTTPSGRKTYKVKDNLLGDVSQVFHLWILGRVIGESNKFMEFAEEDPATGTMILDGLIQRWTTGEGLMGLKPNEYPTTQGTAMVSEHYLKQLREMKRRLDQTRVEEGRASETTLTYPNWEY